MFLPLAKIIIMNNSSKWSKPPKIKTQITPKLPAIQQGSTVSGMPYFLVMGGTEPVLKIEVLFHSGRPFELKKQVSRLTCQMLMEGTATMNSRALSEKFDELGSNISPYLSMDQTGLTLYCLEKHALDLIPTFVEMLLEPAFDPLELDKLKKNAIEKLHHDLSKNDFVAYRELTALIYGPEHFYGYNSNAQIISQVQRHDLVTHFKRTYCSQNGACFVSGRAADKTLAKIIEELGTIPAGQVCEPNKAPHSPTSKANVHLSSNNRHQVALRLGRKLFPRSHPEFAKVYIVNTILGGYFGSRLMSQIREEAGFTYNIYSSIESMKYDGLWYISMETDPDFLEESIKMIESEILKLRENSLGKAELKMVKTYLLGYLLASLDGPLNASELIRNLIMEGDHQLDSFDLLISEIVNFSPGEVLHIAQKYLDPSEFSRIIVGAANDPLIPSSGSHMGQMTAHLPDNED